MTKGFVSLSDIAAAIRAVCIMFKIYYEKVYVFSFFQLIQFSDISRFVKSFNSAILQVGTRIGLRPLMLLGVDSSSSHLLFLTFCGREGKYFKDVHAL